MFLSSPTDEGSPNNLSSLNLTNYSHELGQSHLSSFSIRDYAFTNRTKNIHKSWPFSSTSLQLCLKHGLSDPLPPIQPLGSVNPNLIHVEEVSCKRKLSSNHTLAETKQAFENGSKSKVHVAIMINKNPRKKCGLKVKPEACVNSVSSKEAQDCLMALRTCPICKTFSSASNTTLNAHMDQCLSVDLCRQQSIMSKPKKLWTKPRLKVKTLVDIYTTAKRCTLQDLDKRNGTKWDLAVSDDNKPEVSKKGKKKSMWSAYIEDDAGIGPVYIDAKGQKLRILSEFKEKDSDLSRENEEEDVSEKKSSKEGQGKRLGVKKHYNVHSLSAEPLVLRGPSHASVDLSETVSASFNSQNSWRSCGESQVSGKTTKSPLRGSMPVDKVFTSAPKGVLKLKKASLDFSEDEDEEEDSRRWESEMTQECDDWDDNEETDKVFLSVNPLVSSCEDNAYEGWEETGNNKGDDDMLDDADAEFESMIHEKTAGGSSLFMEVDLIPIPGPPGSFLQSPWDMETENHVNSMFRDNDQSCFCQRKENAFENTTCGSPAPHMNQQDLDLLCKSVLPKTLSSSNPVLRLMGKDLMVINQREETSHGDSSLKPTSQFQDLFKTKQLSPPPIHLLHCPYNTQSFYNIS